MQGKYHTPTSDDKFIIRPYHLSFPAGFPNYIQWHEFKSWTRLIAFHIALMPLEKVWIKLVSLQLWAYYRADCVFQPSLEEGKLWIQTCKTPLKNWPCVISCLSGGVGKYVYPVSVQSWTCLVLAGRPLLACPCVGIHRRTSLMSLSLLLQLCPAGLVRLTWIVYEMGSKWPYSFCFVRCCFKDLFKITRSILV